MAVTGTSRHEHHHDATLYGTVVPVTAQGSQVTPQAGDIWIVTPILTVVAGSPGAFNPLNESPADLVALNAVGTLGQAARWNQGEYIVLVDASEAFWDGQRWVAGRATPPFPTGVNPGAPGVFTPAPPASTLPNDLAELNTLGDLGQTAAWATVGDHVVLGDGSQAHWDGAQFAVGPVPQILVTSVTPGEPGSFLPADADHRDPVDKAELDTINGGAAWTSPNDHVVVGGFNYYWDGTQWTAGSVPLLVATAVTEGAPGAFAPQDADHRDPVDKAELDTINGGTAWTTPGEFVTVGGQNYHWDGAAWQVGAVNPPPLTGVNAGEPGAFTPAQATVPADLTALRVAGALGQTAAWTPRQNVLTGDGQANHWDGTQWQPGPVPLILVASALPGSPGQFDPVDADHRSPATKAELDLVDGGSDWRQNEDITAAFINDWGAFPGNLYLTAADMNGPTSNYDTTSMQLNGAAEFRPDQYITLPGGNRVTWTVQSDWTPWVEARVDNRYVTVAGQDYFWDGTAWQTGRTSSPPVTGVTAGAPGAFIPAIADAPADLTALQALGALGQTDLWHHDTWVVLGDGSEAHWDSTAWVVGRAVNVAHTATEGAPGTFTPAFPRSIAPRTRGELNNVNGGVAWTTPGHYVTVGGQDYYWDGTIWANGRVPVTVATGATEGIPGAFTPAGATAPTTKAELDQIVGVGAAWQTVGAHVAINNLTHDEYYWDGGKWIAGRVPGVIPPDLSLGTMPAYVSGVIPPSTTNFPTAMKMYYKAGQPAQGVTFNWSPPANVGSVARMLIIIQDGTTGAQKYLSNVSKGTIGRGDMTLTLSAQQHPAPNDILRMEFYYTDGSMYSMQGRLS